MPSRPAPGEPRLFAQEDMERPVGLPFASGRALVFSARCPEVERPNQDAAAVIPYGEGAGVLVLADGLGGLPAGARAARIALDSLIRSIAAASREGASLRAAVLDGIERANHEIQDLRIGAGTTVAALEVEGETARPYHVGDSAILVTGQRGRMRLQTVSHSPVGYGVEAGLLDEREAMEHRDRHLLSNLVGTPDMRVEVGSRIRLQARDTALLTSDGLLDNLRTDEIVALIRKGPLERAARALAERARLRMRGGEPGAPRKPDDLTFVLFRRTAG